MQPTLDQKIVKNGSFTWKEYLWLPGFKKCAIITEVQRLNAVELFEHLENFIRKPYGHPLTISSGIRTADYTQHLRDRGIPAALHSAHTTGEGVDLHIPREYSPKGFWDWCAVRWPGRMENQRFTKSWVHLDIRDFGKRIRFNP